MINTRIVVHYYFLPLIDSLWLICPALTQIAAHIRTRYYHTSVIFVMVDSRARTHATVDSK